MAQIKLTKGKYALVDDKDFEALDRHRWHCINGYAARREYFGGKRKAVYILMHRLINNTPDGFDTDHINRDKLDNRRSNLRTTTHQQNAFNPKLSSRSTSGHTGVSWDKKTQSWKAHITIDGRYKHLGRFKSLDQAILERNKEWLALNG